jgi:hypothetical protein
VDAGLRRHDAAFAVGQSKWLLVLDNDFPRSTREIIVALGVASVEDRFSLF